MAMTQKFIVSFALSAGACSDVMEGIAEMRVELRKKAAKIGLAKLVEEAPSGSRQVLEAYLDPEVSLEKVLEITIRTGMRKALEEMRSDDKEGNFQRIGDIKVVRREGSTRGPKVGMWCSVCKNTVAKPCCNRGCGPEVK